MLEGPAGWDAYEDPFDFFEYEEDDEEEEDGNEEVAACGHQHSDDLGHSHSHGGHTTQSHAEPLAAHEADSVPNTAPASAGLNVRRIIRQGVLGSGLGAAGRVIVSQAIVDKKTVGDVAEKLQ